MKRGSKWYSIQKIEKTQGNTRGREEDNICDIKKSNSTGGLGGSVS